MAEQRCPAYYSATLNKESDYPRLEDNINADVAIIGGGFTGINTALELAEKGYSVLVIEKGKEA